MAPCACASETSRTSVAFAGPASLPAILSLPTSLGGSTSTFSQQQNTATTDSSATAESGSQDTNSLSATTSPSAASSPEKNTTVAGRPPDEGLKLGLGLGLSLGVCVIAAVIWCFIRGLLKRRRQKELPPAEQQIHQTPSPCETNRSGEKQGNGGSYSTFPYREVDTTNMSSTSPSLRNELPSDQMAEVRSPDPRYQAVEGTRMRDKSFEAQRAAQNGRWGSGRNSRNGASPAGQRYSSYTLSEGVHELA